MDWCGIVGNVRELFSSKWIAGYHWAVPKISEMPLKVSAVHYSPTFRFMDAAWFLGLYWSSEEWIGMEIWRRSTEHPLQRVCFSVGLMRADKLEYVLHRNQNYPEKDNVCSINRFLPLSFLEERKDNLAPWDTLTITCVIWPDVPSPDEFKRFWHSELRMNSEDEECSNERNKSGIPIASKVKKLQMSASLPNIEINGGHSLDVIATHDAPTTTMLNPSLFSMPNRPIRAVKPQWRCGERRNRPHSRNFTQSQEEIQKNPQQQQKEEEEKGVQECTEDSNAVPLAEVVPEPPKEVLNSNKSATNKTVPKSGTHFGILREFSKGVEWEVALPSATSKSTWNFTSPRFRCGELRCFFNLCPRTDEDIWLRFTILSEDVNFSLPIRWRLSVKSHDPPGLVGIINGWRSGDLENNQYVQEISLQRDDVESCLSSGARITFVCHLSMGEVAMAMEDSVQQREKILVSCETQTEDELDVDEQTEDELDVDEQTEDELDVDEQTKDELDIDDQTEDELDVDEQTEDELDVEPTEIHSTADLKQNKESEECDLGCLEIPQEEECIRHIQQSFERNLQKLLSENPKSRRKHFMSAA